MKTAAHDKHDPLGLMRRVTLDAGRNRLALRGVEILQQGCDIHHCEILTPSLSCT